MIHRPKDFGKGSVIVIRYYRYIILQKQYLEFQQMTHGSSKLDTNIPIYGRNNFSCPIRRLLDCPCHFFLFVQFSDHILTIFPHITSFTSFFFNFNMMFGLFHPTLGQPTCYKNPELRRDMNPEYNQVFWKDLNFSNLANHFCQFVLVQIRSIYFLLNQTTSVLNFDN